MIVGARRWNDPECYFRQDNNATEEELRKLGFSHWLQSCGSSAAATCAACVGYDVTIRCPGGYIIPADEALTDYLNDPSNYAAFKREAPWIDPTREPGNRHAAYYPLAARAVLGATARHWTGATPARIVEQLRMGRAVQACIVPPGHYVAVVAWDEDAGELVYHDPWPGRVGGDGFARRFTEAGAGALVAEAVVWEE